MGACTQPGNLLIVTELMPRGSVYDLLRDSKVSLSFKRKMLIAKDAALGVNWLHRSKPQFLHLDLKAANLLVDQNWTVKVADFGLSVVKKEAATKKEKHGPIGTPLWMAPEVLMNKEYDEKADVYSFGIVLWEILTAQDPWQEIDSLVELVEAVCIENRVPLRLHHNIISPSLPTQLPLCECIITQQRPVLPADLPSSLVSLVNSCWMPAPDSRPAFEDIVPRFDDIVLDGTIPDPTGRACWRSSFPEKHQVPWPEFVKAFVPAAQLPAPTSPTDIHYQVKIRTTTIKTIISHTSYYK